MQTALTRISSNVKTGPIPVSTSSKATCPDACPFKAGGCYAKGGPLNIHWEKVTIGERGVSFDDFCGAVSKLPKGQLWRHLQAGDLDGENNFINPESLEKLTKANKGRKGFCYTHKPILNESVSGDLSESEKDLLVESNRNAIKKANDNGFTINLSGNNFDHADKLKALNIGPVVVVMPSDNTVNTVTPNGNKVVICPATYKDDVTCASCGLCQKGNRSVIVGFPAHGNGKKKVNEITKN